MKILFITNNFLKNNSNSNILKNLIKAFPENCDTHILLTDEVGARVFINDKEIKHIYKGFGLFRRDFKMFFSFKLNFLESVLLLRNLLYRILEKIFRIENPEWDMKIKNTIGTRELNDYIKKEKYDVIISMSYPFDCHHLAYKIKSKNKDLIWFAYYLDPFFSNHGMKKIKEKCLSLEDRVLSLSDAIFLTPIMYDEFKGSILNKYIDKCIVCEFPNMVDFRDKVNNSVVSFDKSYINCVFVGHIYNKIRNPKFLFDLLLKSDENIRFYIIGGFYGDLDDDFKNYYMSKLGNRLNIVGSVDLNEALSVMNDADILINIGNLISNQLPSKIFDYLSTGKPIVNICKLKECPSLKYMEKYPLALNIFEQDGINEEIVRKFESFCENSKEKQIPFAEIEKEFLNCTPEYVAKQMYEMISKT